MKIWISRDKVNTKHDVIFWTKEPIIVDGIFRGLGAFMQDIYADNFPFRIEKGDCKLVEMNILENPNRADGIINEPKPEKPDTEKC
jgi:hypothetical protein